MTVAELIEKLKKLPQDLPVYVADHCEEYAADTPLTCASIERETKAGHRDGVQPRRLTLQTTDCGKDIGDALK